MDAATPTSNATKVKKLIVCCDGTWMDSDSSVNHVPSNVTLLARAIKPADDDGTPQIVYYQAGIGTGLGLWDQMVGGGTGLGYSENLREAYAFLAHNFHQEPDRSRSDSIFLLGFSRGAYTARSLGGMIGQLGLLTKKNMYWFIDIFRDWQNAGNPHYTPAFWKNWSDYNDRVFKGPRHSIKAPAGVLGGVNTYLEEYRKSLLKFGLTQEADVTAIGVFDTVGALGIPINPFFQKTFRLPSFLHTYKWVDTSLDNHVKNAFQALALDEHRAPFLASVWEKSDDCQTNLKQVWFAGAHSNIGGAYSDIATANLTLAWMMDQLAGDDLKRNKPSDWNSELWLDFDVGFIKNQRLLNLDYQQILYGTARKWGLGTIYNSLTFPQVLAGAGTRAPGRTRPVKYPHEVVDDTRLLRNTNERIHASVRVRNIRAGHFYEPDPDAGFTARVVLKVLSAVASLVQKVTGRDAKRYYNTQLGGPLKNWVLRDGFKIHDEYSIDVMDEHDQGNGQTPYWEFHGKDSLLREGSIMPEDELGTFEKMLLKDYVDCAEWIEKSNGGQVRGVISPDAKNKDVQQIST
ncbi:hypothetical protein ANO11243_096390 [Dothideomycetidae sp. 11243]|nr:hypothetical protein ANO11243_096390 [fungal sp. No.11243]